MQTCDERVEAHCIFSLTESESLLCLDKQSLIHQEDLLPVVSTSQMKVSSKYMTTF